MQSKLSLLPLLLATTSTAYLLPNPPGKYNVTLTNGPLTDYTRDGRTLMISVFQPATCKSIMPVPYMPNKTAEHEGPWLQKVFDVPIDLTSFFEGARLPVCPKDNDQSNCTPLDDAPVLLLSPGYRGTRLYYNFLASAIASEGYTVITIDHPGETNVVTYPDGHAVYSDLPDLVDLDESTPYAYTRATDASFVIDQLTNTTAMTNLGLLSRHFPTDRVAMAGHSLGGAAAVLAAAQDSRINSVINWDGPFLGSLPPSGLPQPVLYIASERDDDPRFMAVWPQLEGAKLWVKVTNLMHEGMMDFPTLLQAAGVDGKGFADQLGTIAPVESVGILTAYTTEWMKSAFAGKVGGPLLEGKEMGRFPEVSVLLRDNF